MTTLAAAGPVPAAVPFSAGHLPPAVPLPAGACDCHIHMYDHRFPKVPGTRLDPPDASVADYRQVQRRLGTARAVVVTPSTYGADNRCMLEAVEALGDAARGVAVIDGSESDAALENLHARGVRGVRLNLSLGVSGSVDSILPIAFRIADLGWHLQLLMPADQLASLGDVLHRAAVPLVFDHFGRIRPGHAADQPALDLLLTLLEEGRAWVKLSGGYIVSAMRSTDDPALGPLAARFLTAAPDRVLWGSDWPHATASAGVQPMPDDARQIDRLAEWVGSAHLLQRVLVSNPQTLYGFPSIQTTQGD